LFGPSRGIVRDITLHCKVLYLIKLTLSSLRLESYRLVPPSGNFPKKLSSPGRRFRPVI
jgi:hypothetical protein